MPKHSLQLENNEKTADNWRRHHWFFRQMTEMTSEKRAKKFHTDGVLLPQIREVLLIG